MNAGTMRILAIEDNPADVRLLREYLAESSLADYILTSTGTLAEGLALLMSEAFSVVVLDLNLPDSSGMEGLEKIAEQWPHLPVILLTGVDNEETGLLALSKHAQDYLVKGKFDGELLARSIRYAIERVRADETIRGLNADLMVANENLKKSRDAAINIMEDALDARREVVAEKNRLEAVMEALPVGVAILDARGGSLRSNPMFERIWGAGRPAVKSVDDNASFRAWWSDSGETVRPEEWGSAVTVRTGEPVIDQMMRIERFDGTLAHIINNAAPIFDADGGIAGSAVAIQDITRIREAEEALRRSTERYELLAGTAGELLNAKDPQTVVNSLCARVMAHLDCHVFFNFLADDKAGRLHLNAYAGIPEEEGRRIEWLDYGVAVCGCAARDECRIIAEHIPTTPDVRTELVKSYGVLAYACHPLFGEDGRVMGTLSFGTKTRETFTEDDLSLMKAVADQVAVAMMRMRNEQALRESEERFRAALRNAPITVATLDRDLRYTWVYNTRHGFTPDMVLGKRPDELLPPGETEGMMSLLQRALETGQTQQGVISGRTGERRWAYDMTVDPRTSDDGDITGVIIVNIDISERLQHENELSESRKDLARAQAVAHIGSWRLNVARNELTWSDENHRIFGIPKPAELTYETFLNTVHPDDRANVDQKWNAALKGEPYDVEHRIIVGGVTKWIREVAELEFDKDGALLGGFGTSQDITLYKWTEQALFQTERQFHALFDAMNECVLLNRLVCDESGVPSDFDIISANESVERQLGMNAGQVVGIRGSDLYGAAPPPYLDDYARVSRTGTPIRFESYFAGLDRHLSISVFSLGEGRFVTLLEDISIRKIAEQEMRDTLSATTDGVWKRNPQTGEVYFSPRYYTMLGYEPDEFPASLESWKSLIHPDDLDRAMSVHAAFEQGNADSYANEFRLRTKKGDYRLIRSRAKVVRRNEHGERTWIIGNHDDITDERARERLIEETNRLLAVIIDNTDLLIAYLDKDGVFLRVNRAFAMFNEKDPAFFNGKKLTEFMSFEGMAADIREVVSTGRPHYEKARVIAGALSTDDSLVYWDWSLIPVMHSNDSISGVVLTLVDVTQHKKIEEELIHFNDRLEKEVRERTAELSIINKSLKEEMGHRMTLMAEKENAYRELDVIFNSMTVGMTVIDTEFNFLRANRRFLQMFNLDASQVLNQKCYDFWPGDHCGTDRCPMCDIMAGKGDVEFELRHADAAGRELIFQVSASPYYSANGEIAGMIRNVIDITEKREIQRKLISSIDDERQKISYELHDGLGQDLTAIGFLVESVRQGLDGKERAPLAKLEEVAGIVQSAQVRSRSISKLLSPVDMEQGAFVSSIEELAKFFERIYDIRCVVGIDGPVVIRENTVATNLFYVVREAINNSIKHAKPKAVYIRMARDGDGLSITVSDDGTGAGEINVDKGMGLQIMKHRAEIAGATFMVTRSSAGGVVINLRLQHP